jgi:hypothetical protein
MEKYVNFVEVIFYVRREANNMADARKEANNMADTRNFSSDFCLMAIINK